MHDSKELKEFISHFKFEDFDKLLEYAFKRDDSSLFLSIIYYFRCIDDFLVEFYFDHFKSECCSEDLINSLKNKCCEVDD